MTAPIFHDVACGCGRNCAITTTHNRMARTYQVRIECLHGGGRRPDGGFTPPWIAAVNYTEQFLAGRPQVRKLHPLGAGTLGTHAEYLAGSGTPTLGAAPPVNPRSLDDIPEPPLRRCAGDLRADDEFTWSDAVGIHTIPDWDGWWVALVVDRLGDFHEVKIVARSVDGERYRSRVVPYGLVAIVRRSQDADADIDGLVGKHVALTEWVRLSQIVGIV